LLAERLAAQTRAYLTVSAAFNDLIHHVQSSNIDVGPALAIAVRAGATATGGGAGSATNGGKGAAAVPAVPAPAPVPGAAAADDPESDGELHHPTSPTASSHGFEGFEPTSPFSESSTTDRLVALLSGDTPALASPS
jgi:hypothetical protein